MPEGGEVPPGPAGPGRGTWGGRCDGECPGPQGGLVTMPVGHEGPPLPFGPVIDRPPPVVNGPFLFTEGVRCKLCSRHATSVRQGNWFSVTMGPVSKATH